MNLIHALYQINAIKFGEFTLKSGQTSHIYLDLRQIVSYPEILRAVSDAIWQKIQNCHFDFICGVPYTALPIATGVSLQHNIPMIMRRKEKKAYGTKQQIEGNFKKNQTCLIIEDVITTGSSIIETADELLEAGLQVRDLAVLIDREEGGFDHLQQKNYKVHAVFTLTDIMKTLINQPLLTATEQQIVNQLLHERI